MSSAAAGFVQFAVELAASQTQTLAIECSSALGGHTRCRVAGRAGPARRIELTNPMLSHIPLLTCHIWNVMVFHARDVRRFRQSPRDGQVLRARELRTGAGRLTAESLTVEEPSRRVDGWYLRNGPNPREASGHWFTGDGMLHGVRIEGRRQVVPQSLGAHRQLHRPVPLYSPDGSRNLRAAVANLTSSITPGRRWRSSIVVAVWGDDRLETVGCYDFGA